MTTQTKPSVEIAINELEKNIRYIEGIKKDLVSGVLQSQYSRFAVGCLLKGGIAQLRSSLETQINDLNTFEAEFEDALKEAK